MNEIEKFRGDLARFASRQRTKTEAAEALGVSRTDFYRYLAGKTVPRRPRRDQMARRMRAIPGRRPIPAPVSEIQQLDVKSVTQLRNLLLHLVHMLDLDLAGRVGKVRKGG
jgi:hypothetical protein